MQDPRPEVAPNSGPRKALSPCLSLDLEVGPRSNRIRALAGIRSDTGQSLNFSVGRGGLAAALAKLDDLADGAESLLGHNLIDFDLPHLQAANPRLRLLRLPAVDTLRLNPLAFPRNPYHHLVKHYQDGQLRRGRINDPEMDARLTLEVFDNQKKALRDTPPGLLAAWHWLTTANDGAGFDRVFTSLRQSGRPSDTEAYDAIYNHLDGHSCQNTCSLGLGECRAPRLGSRLCIGVAIGVRRQLRYAALGAPPIPRCGTFGRPDARQRLRQSRLRMV